MIKKSAGLVSSIAVSVEPSDLGTAAYKNTGTNAGDIPVLDSNGKLNTGTIPAVAITDVFTANSEQAMLALSAEKGDVCIRTDENNTYILMSSPASTLSNWIQISSSTSVISVNGKTGTVTLDSDDVGAVAKNSAITGSTKCKITYDSKGLVTSGADLQASDIPDISSSYVSKNADITGATKCKITYDSKGLVTSGADLQASDIPDLSSSYVAKNSAITGATKCKITYDAKGLVTSGADLQASDIPDISANYVATNSAITSATKCKITYDTKGLVTAGADLQSSDIPDLSSSYVAKNTDITSATKCKITYDAKGLVTAGADLSSSDLPSHEHSASDITSGILPIAKGGTSSTNKTDAVVSLGLSNKTEATFSGSTGADYLSNVQSYFVTNNTNCVPYTYNADWTGTGDGVAMGVATKSSDTSRYLFSFNRSTGVKFFHQSSADNFAWKDYSWTGIPIYVNATGTQGTINFDAGYTAELFRYITIYYYVLAATSLWLRSSVTSHSATGTNVNMTGMYYDGTDYKCYTRSVTINSTSLTLTSNTRGTMRYTTSSSGATSTGDNIYITHIVGHKYA